MAFEVNQKFIAQLETGEDTLKHIFKVPNSLEWQRFNSLRWSGAEKTMKTGEEIQFTVDVGNFSKMEMEAASALWDACIENVEGYTIDGQPLTCETKGWREKVWFPHKMAAIIQLVKFFEGKKENLEKN